MKLILTIGLFFSFNLFASNWPSTVRPAGISYTKMMQGKWNKGGDSQTNPISLASYYSNFNAPEIPSWKSYHQVMEAFTTARDLRFMDWKHEGKNIPRRSTWLYPDDGCYIRGELMVKNLEALGYNNFYKVFVFGDLLVETENHYEGYVRWWYHVVPLIALDGQYLALDPAINPEEPLTLENWLYTMSDNIDSLEIVVCAAHTVGPYDDCFNPKEESTGYIIIKQRPFLTKEWFRLEILKRDPFQELGDNPPWL